MRYTDIMGKALPRPTKTPSPFKEVSVPLIAACPYYSARNNRKLRDERGAMQHQVAEEVSDQGGREREGLRKTCRCPTLARRDARDRTYPTRRENALSRSDLPPSPPPPTPASEGCSKQQLGTILPCASRYTSSDINSPPLTQTSTWPYGNINTFHYRYYYFCNES